MKVLISGPTGLVGQKLLEKLIGDSRITEVHSIARNPTQLKSPKLKEHIFDLRQLEEKAPEEKFDVVYCCLGTTIKKAGSKENFKLVDFEFVVSLARKFSSSNQFLVVSAMGADASSKIFYNRTKGEMEEAVVKSGISTIRIFRPSLLLGDRKEFRFGEKVGSIFMKMFRPLMIGSLKKYRPIEAEDVASAMLTSTFLSDEGICIYNSREIQEIADKANF